MKKLLTLLAAITIVTACQQQPGPQPTTPATPTNPSGPSLEQEIIGNWVLGKKEILYASYSLYSSGLNYVGQYNDTAYGMNQMVFSMISAPTSVGSDFKVFRGMGPAGAGSYWKVKSTNQIQVGNYTYNVNSITSDRLVISYGVSLRFYYYKYNSSSPTYLDTLNTSRNSVFGIWTFDSSSVYNSNVVHVSSSLVGAGDQYNFTNNTYTGTQSSQKIYETYRMNIPGQITQYHTSGSNTDLYLGGVTIFDGYIGGVIRELTPNRMVLETTSGGYTYYYLHK